MLRATLTIFLQHVGRWEIALGVIGCLGGQLTVVMTAVRFLVVLSTGWRSR